MASEQVRYLSPLQVTLIQDLVIGYSFDRKIPIPDLNILNQDRLDSTLALPRQGFGDQDNYPNIHQKAAAYFYYFIKNHAFRDGNKRMAVISTYVFLNLNGMTLSVVPEDLYNLAIDIAKEEGEPFKVISAIGSALFKFTGIKRP